MSMSRPLTPWILSAPALLLFSGLLLAPLLMTGLLSFHVFDYNTGVKNEYTLAHYIAVLTDPYYFEIFWRTLWVSAVTTGICLLIGAPEAYVLSRVRSACWSFWPPCWFQWWSGPLAGACCWGRGG